MAACSVFSCPFCSRITSFHRIRNSKTPVAHGPDVGFNAYNEMRACGAAPAEPLSCHAIIDTDSLSMSHLILQ